MNQCCGSLADSRSLMESINSSCLCMQLGTDAMTKALDASGDIPNLHSLLAERPVLFAQTPVFVSSSDVEIMSGVIKSIESIIDSPDYRQFVADRNALGASSVRHATPGIMMGYDFHLGADGPALIEINTNAGGAFLAHEMERAMGILRSVQNNTTLGDLQQQAQFIVQMIHREWRAAGRTSPLESVAIVDDSPEEQFLYPDMLLAQKLLTSDGVKVHIVDASELRYHGKRLSADGQSFDFVYNRLTDFQLTEARHTALGLASLEDAVVISPAPMHHALYADKRNLAVMTDADLLRGWGVAETDIEILSQIPESTIVDESNVSALWAERKRYFFKPISGYGGKAVYRGDKLTRRVWSHIVSEPYLAQRAVQPGVRAVRPGSDDTDSVVAHKYDLRVFTYAGHAYLITARLYQGQTTNFRTPGGGFAPVLLVGEEASQCLIESMRPDPGPGSQAP